VSSAAEGRPKIALLVDHPERDLPGLVLTAVELCRRGAVCHLVPANLAWKEIWALVPDFTLFNYFRRSNEPLGRGLAEAGLAFGALDTEGGVWPDFNAYTELLWTDESLRRQAACVCAWGRRMADHLVEERWFRPDQVVVTGCPRFDFYHPDWRPVIEANGAERNAVAPQVLLNTNFSTRNPRFATVEQKIETSMRNFGWSLEQIRSLLDTEERAIDAFIQIARRLARERPECRVLVRPHPFEDPAWYRRALADQSNVIVDNDGPVQPVLFASAAVVQRSCTTGIEAGLAGRPTFSPQWVDAPWLMPTAEAVSVPCATYEEVSAGIGAVLERRFVPEPSITAAIQGVVSDWFCSADGGSHRRVAEAVLDSLPASRPSPGTRAARHLYLADAAGRPLTGMSAVGGHLRLAARLSPDFSFRAMGNRPALRWTRTPKYFDAPRVQALADGVLAANGQRASGMRVRAGAARDSSSNRHGLHMHTVTLTWS
jgi:surface carbohydrate biosynthesis protein